MAAAFLRQLNQLLQTQQPIMGDQWECLLDSQSEAAIRTIRQSPMTLEDGTEICRLVEQGPWSAEQKKKLGAAVSETLAGNTQPNTKGKKKNQEVSNFWGFLNAEDRRVLTGDDTLVLRLTHTAQIMARLEMFWPSEQSVGHIIKTLQSCQNSGLQSPDEFHSAVVSLKKKVKSLLKGTSCGEFVAKYTRPEDLPPHIRDRFGDALGGEIHGTVVLASDALRGSNKNLAIHKSNTAMMLAHPAAGQAMHMPNTMQGMMQFIGMAANMFNQQQQQTPPKKHDGLPGLKIFGEQSPANQSGVQASTPSPQQALQLPVPAQNDGPAEATGAKQPEQQQQLPSNKDPISAAEHADHMLEAWKGTKEGFNSSAQPKAKAKAKSKAKSQPKAAAKAKAKAQCMKSQPKAKAKAKAKAACKAKAKSQPKAVVKKFTRDQVRKMTLAARISMRPHGCTKCRSKPGCTPSCFSK